MQRPSRTNEISHLRRLQEKKLQCVNRCEGAKKIITDDPQADPIHWVDAASPAPPEFRHTGQPPKIAPVRGHHHKAAEHEKILHGDGTGRVDISQHRACGRAGKAWQIGKEMRHNDQRGGNEPAYFQRTQNRPVRWLRIFLEKLGHYRLN